MGDVDDADRQDVEARADAVMGIDVELEPRLLELDLARPILRGQRVLQLELGSEANGIGEFVVEVKHEAMKVHAVAVVGITVGNDGVVIEVIVMQLTIAANGGALGPRRGDRSAAESLPLDGIRRRLDGLGVLFELGCGGGEFLLGTCNSGDGLIELPAQCLDSALLSLHDLPQLIDVRLRLGADARATPRVRVKAPAANHVGVSMAIFS